LVLVSRRKSSYRSSWQSWDLKKDFSVYYSF